MDILGERRAGTQPRVGPDAAVGADRGAIEVRKRADDGAGTDRDIAQHAIGTDRDTLSQRDIAFEDTADIDAHVAAAVERAANVDARGIGERRARCHQRACQPRLHDPFDRRELRAIVDAAHVALVGGDMRHHRGSIRNCQSDDVGQVILALRVVRLQ